VVKEKASSRSKDQVSTSANGRVEWERKRDETKRKTERKEGNREDIHRQRPYKTRTRDTEETKDHRKEEEREGKKVKVGYRKITMEGVQEME
jgi:hypothetical protein